MAPQRALHALQLRDVQDSLRKPLTGRQVLIPLGTKAFVSGQLEPLRNERREELIKLRAADTEELQDISRQQGIEVIQQEIKDLRPTRKKPPATTTDKSSPASSSSSKPAPYQPTPQQSSETTIDPNFFEIREEVDEHGREVHSEAVNITDHLKLWEQETKKADSEGKGAGSGAAPFTRPQETTIPASDNAGDNMDDSVGIQGESSGTKEGQSTPQGVSDVQYDSMIARLDELALLEEEEEKRKVEGQKSVKKLQNTGWSKGFLNRPSKPATKRKTTAEAPTSGRANIDSSLHASGHGQKEKKTDAGADRGASSLSDKKKGKGDNAGSGRAVGFAKEESVLEIPRVGHRSVSEGAKAVKPIEDNVLSGMVRERPRASKLRKSTTTTGIPVQSPTTTTTQPQKKLSRFAQQRTSHQS